MEIANASVLNNESEAAYQHCDLLEKRPVMMEEWAGSVIVKVKVKTLVLAGKTVGKLISKGKTYGRLFQNVEY